MKGREQILLMQHKMSRVYLSCLSSCLLECDSSVVMIQNIAATRRACLSENPVKFNHFTHEKKTCVKMSIVDVVIMLIVT